MDERPVLDQVNIVVADMAASAAFAAVWNRAGPTDRGWVIGFRFVERDAVTSSPHGSSTPVTAVSNRPSTCWGARYAVVTDPDGNAVGIMSAIDPGRRSDVAAPD